MRYYKMSDLASSSAETLGRTSECLPTAKKSAKIHFREVIDNHGAVLGDLQAVTQPPHQQVFRSADVTGKKQKSSRRSSKTSNVQGPVLSANHIEEAAGDDRCARCLLAVLFCEVSILCSTVLGCLSCGLCSDGALCGSLCPSGLMCARLWPCEPGCAVLDEGCRSSDCLDICLECCSLCFPS
ncbi:myoD family inhibitor domain-containing protein-like isoform X2 [Dendrobates tinctorius]|uniref:myoD family inhibitor domain-containing protein-like isoform X2 n=1 Tax=Dendrobates tinctorius TaxID=92724 RepID=UPI003CC935DB